MKLDIREVRLRSVLASEIDHFGCHVDSDRSPAPADELGCEEDIQPSATAQVDHGFTLSKGSERSRVAAGKAHVGLGGDRGQFACTVTEGLGHGLHTAVVA